MYSQEKESYKDRPKMNLSRTKKKLSDYFIYIIVIAIIAQLILLVYRLSQL